MENKKNFLIKYDNDFQKINLSKLTALEFRGWMFILLLVKNKMRQIMKVPFSDFQKELNTHFTNDQFFDFLTTICDKLLTQRIKLINKEKTRVILFTFFTEFEIDRNTQIVTMQVNKKFLYFVNNIIKNYSVLKFDEIKKLRSKYALMIYKKIREFYKQGKYEFNTYEEFKKFLNITNHDQRYITQKVFIQIEKELPKYVSNFKFEKVRTSKNKPIQKIVLTWEPNDNENVEQPDYMKYLNS